MQKDELFRWATQTPPPTPNPPLCEALGTEMLETLKEMKLARRKEFWNNPGFLALVPLYLACAQLRAQHSPEDIAAMSAQAKAMGTTSGVVRRYNEVCKAFKTAWRETYAIPKSEAEEAEEAAAEVPAAEAPAAEAPAAEAPVIDMTAGEVVSAE